MQSCSDDDDPAESYETELVDLLTDESGIGRTIITDGGNRLLLHNPQQGYAPDTIYRCIAMFVRKKDGVNLANIARIPCTAPSYFKNTPIITDSLKLQSIWRGSHYVNISLLVQMKDQRHSFGFANPHISTYTDGHRRLDILLYHNANNDVPAFYNTAYLSCDIAGYADSLIAGRDSVSFLINEYGKGPKQYAVTY